MFEVLSDPAIYEFEGVIPPSVERLADGFRRRESRQSPDGTERLLNWVVRLPSGQLAGYVQATVLPSGASYIGYEFASKYWRRGLGKSSVVALMKELQGTYGVNTFVAVLKRANYRSMGLLEQLGFTPCPAEQTSQYESELDEAILVKPAGEFHVMPHSSPSADVEERARAHPLRHALLGRSDVGSHMKIPDRIHRFWQAFARTQALDPTPRFLEALHFDDNAPSANELAELVLAGRKRATAGLVWSFEQAGAPIPKPGDLSVVTDFAGTPLCVIETKRVDIVPFEEVCEEFAATEGEGDGSLAYWREAHQAYFGRECERIGRIPDSRMPVVCERFEVVYREPGGE